MISGTPPITDLNSDGTAKTYSFVLKVTDSQMPTSAYQTGGFSITINPLPTVTTTTLPNGTIGLSYSAPLTSHWRTCSFYVDCNYRDSACGIGSRTRPRELSLGLLPGPSGSFPITVQVTDADSNTATANLSITIVGRLQGTFAFSFNGFDNGQPFYTVGSFVGDGNGTLPAAFSIRTVWRRRTSSPKRH